MSIGLDTMVKKDDFCVHSKNTLSIAFAVSVNTLICIRKLPSVGYFENVQSRISQYENDTALTRFRIGVSIGFID